MKEPIRVLHVVTYMGRGGLETMIMNYYRHIDRDKVQFDFLVHRDFEADYDSEILELGGKIYHIPPLNPVSIKYLKCLDDFFSKHKEYRIVHSHLDCMAGIPLKYAKKNNVPVRIAHAHSSSQTKDSKYLLKLLFKKNILKFSTQLFACAEMAGKWMFNTSKFVVLNNAIDTHQYIYNPEVRTKIRNELCIGKDKLVIGHVGRFAVPKNHKLLLEIFAEILKNEFDAVLLLVGDGELRTELETKAKHLGILEKTIFTGLREDVNEILQAMDVFVFPSIYEGLPVSLVEAQAAGLPCIISDKVPMECKKTKLVYQMNLTDSTELWANRIVELSKKTRVNTYEDIKKAGFDIVENAKWLENFYQDAYDKENKEKV